MLTIKVEIFPRFLIMSSQRNYSDDTRKSAIILVVDDGKSQKQVASDLRIKKSTLSVWIKEYRESQKVTKSSRGGCRHVSLTQDIKDDLERLIEDDCTITLQSMIEKLSLTVHPSTVWRWLKSMNMTFKLARPIPQSRNCESVKIERKAYAEWYTNVSIDRRYQNLIFVDESPFTLHMIRNHGRALRGETPNPVVRNSRGDNVTMILAVSAISVVHCEAIFGSVDHVVFQTFLAKLEDVLGEGDYTIVMDNVRFHHSNMEFYDDYNYEIHYLPRYSPFLNPCEEVFSEIKSKIRRDGPLRGRNDLLQRMQEASNSISQQHLKNYFQHSETFLGKCHTLQDIERN